MKSFSKKQKLAFNAAAVIMLGGLLLTFQNCTSGFKGAAQQASTLAVGDDESDSLEANSARVELPIFQQTFDNGTKRYSIPIKIGTLPVIEAELDTGSSGLRVFANAVQASDYADYSTPSNQTYGQGVQFLGELVNGRLKLGKIKRKIDFAVVNSLGCAASNPNCPVAGLTIDNYRIGGLGVEGMGFQAIIGIGMRNVDTPNPLVAMGINRWIVILPQPDDENPGTLILNPSDDELNDFQLVQLNQMNSGVGWYDNRLQGCLTNQNNGNAFCLNTIMDTGAFNLQVKSNNFGAPRTIAPSLPFNFNVKQDGNDVASIDFNSSEQSSSKIVFSSQANELMNVGPFPFYYYSIYYNYEDGLIGFQGR